MDLCRHRSRLSNAVFLTDDEGIFITRCTVKKRGFVGSPGSLPRLKNIQLAKGVALEIPEGALCPLNQHRSLG